MGPYTFPFPMGHTEKLEAKARAKKGLAEAHAKKLAGTNAQKLVAPALVATKVCFGRRPGDGV